MSSDPHEEDCSMPVWTLQPWPVKKREVALTTEGCVVVVWTRAGR